MCFISTEVRSLDEFQLILKFLLRDGFIITLNCSKEWYMYKVSQYLFLKLELKLKVVDISLIMKQ